MKTVKSKVRGHPRLTDEKTEACTGASVNSLYFLLNISTRLKWF